MRRLRTLLVALATLLALAVPLPASAAALSCSHPAQGLHSYGVPNYKHAIYLTAAPDVIAHVYKFVAGSWKFQGSVRINCD